MVLYIPNPKHPVAGTIRPVRVSMPSLESSSPFFHTSTSSSEPYGFLSCSFYPSNSLANHHFPGPEFNPPLHSPITSLVPSDANALEHQSHTHSKNTHTHTETERKRSLHMIIHTRKRSKNPDPFLGPLSSHIVPHLSRYVPGDIQTSNESSLFRFTTIIN